jgi:hypothetical protein
MFQLHLKYTLKLFKTCTSRWRSIITTLALKRTVFLFSHVTVWGRYCACPILIANPIDWLYAGCLEYVIFVSIDSSEARKQYDELSVNHANNNLRTWQNAFSRHRMDSSLWSKRVELIEVKSLIWVQKGKLYITYENMMWILRILRFKFIHLLFYTFIHMYISNYGNVILKYFHFVLLVVFF